MANTVFHPEHQALKDIFSSDTTYIIPEYQRPYSWQALGKSDTNNQINQMWDDLWEFFESNDATKEYFLGSMVIIEKQRGKLEVVDGQQRITSLSLLFCAMVCFLEYCRRLDGEYALSDELRAWTEKAQSTLGRLIYNEGGLDLASELKVKVQRSTGYDFDSLLNKAARGEPESSIGAIERKHREIAQRYFRNRDYFLEKLKETFLHNGRFSDQEARLFSDFFLFLRTRVAIVTIKTTDFDTAFSIFEILNNRGLPLSNKDLLRNFVLNELTRAKRDQLSTEKAAELWEDWETNYPLTDEFIARWAESLLGKKQQKSAFNSIKSIYEARYQDSHSRSRITQFCKHLTDDLGYYSLIADPDAKVKDIALRNKIKGISILGNSRYSSDLMLALFRHFRCTGDNVPAELIEFLRIYQRYALYIALSPGRRFHGAPIWEAIQHLQENRVEEAKKSFFLSAEEMARLSELLASELDNTSASILLATYVWHEESVVEDVVTQTLDYRRATLEHIIPLSPKADSDWLTLFDDDFRREYTNRLGNMTLLTHGKNSRAKNHSFTHKRKEYQRTQLTLTRELAEQTSLTPEYIKQRHERILAGLRAELGLHAP